MDLRRLYYEKREKNLQKCGRFFGRVEDYGVRKARWFLDPLTEKDTKIARKVGLLSKKNEYCIIDS